MVQTTAVVIGAGHVGLAMSRRLTERWIDHVVLERGEVANSWRTERWPSLRLLTPDWLTRLPGCDYAGDDPHGYMPVAGVVAALTRYARLAAAPLRTATTVYALRAAAEGFEIRANDDVLCARAAVLATGARALDADQGDGPEPARPAQQAGVPGRGGRELLDAVQPANGVQRGPQPAGQRPAGTQASSARTRPGRLSALSALSRQIGRRSPGRYAAQQSTDS